jgi:predicted TIM-barrel fold metal-dependent hydrolase
MRTITLEEHYATAEFMEGPGRGVKDRLDAIADKLVELGENRIAEMDAAGIDVQVLSLTAPGVEQLEAAEAVGMAKASNDHLAEAMRKHPTRFGGFAALPTADPGTAAAELERTVKKYGFKGTLINGHSRGRYLDDKFFWPILERAEALSVPIYLHPTRPPQAVIEASYGGFSPIITNMLAGAGWGWHIETAVHVIRLILGGAFDRFPKLQIVIGHMGEGLPFMIQRLDIMSPAMTKLRQPISAYLRQNVHYTFGGFNFLPNFLDLLLQVGADRIMFSADHPYASMAQARAFLDQLPVSTADREKIAHGNAERLFRM